jgi:dihydrofolate reductase
MKINLIIAIDKNGVMGNENKLPWILKDDLKHFKNVTNGSPLIMGSNTFKSLPGILPGREHLVLSTTLYGDENMSVFTSIKEAIEYCDESNYKNVYVIGGANLVKQFIDLNLFDELILTHVETDVIGDTVLELDDLQLQNWRISKIEKFNSDERNEYPFTIVNYIKTTKRFY